MSEPTTQKFHCDQCGRKFAWRPDMVGKRAKCPCGNALVVPETPGGPAPVVPPVGKPAEWPAVSPPTVLPPPVPVPCVAPPAVPVTAESPQQPGRPEYMTVLGIVSIAVGAMSLVLGGLSAFRWWTRFAQSVGPGVSPGYSTPFRPLMPGDPTLMQALAAFFAASGLVSLLLVAAGVLTLLKHRRGLTYHLYFAVLKVICIIVEVLLTMAYLHSTKVLLSYPRQRFNADEALTTLMVSVGLQLVYPLLAGFAWLRLRGEEAASGSRARAPAARLVSLMLVGVASIVVAVYWLYDGFPGAWFWTVASYDRLFPPKHFYSGFGPGIDTRPQISGKIGLLIAQAVAEWVDFGLWMLLIGVGIITIVRPIKSRRAIFGCVSAMAAGLALVLGIILFRDYQYMHSLPQRYVVSILTTVSLQAIWPAVLLVIALTAMKPKNPPWQTL